MSLKGRLEEARRLVEKHSQVRVFTHTDADGLSAGAIASRALEREGKEVEVETLSSINKGNCGELEPADLNVFTDLGSGYLYLMDKFRNSDTIILDHHKPQGEEWDSLVHVNPELEGYDGGNEISGAGVAYLFAKELSEENKDLSALAVVGAVGDVQNLWGKFEGLNVDILKDAVDAGVVMHEKDLMFYGRHTRPIFKTLQYFTDPFVPGVSNNESGCVALLQHLGIEPKDGDRWRTAIDLEKEEKMKIADALIQGAMEKIPQELTSYVPGLVIGDIYTLLNEEKGSELRGASEFSTCLNATGRNDRPEVGLELAKGERGDVEKELMSLLRVHRRNIAQGLEFVEGEGVKVGPGNFVQYFDAGEGVKSTIVGTIAGMMLGTENIDPYKPIIGLSDVEGGAKASARCSRVLILKGIDMSEAIKNAANSVGGTGGGHAVACGAFVPEGKKEEFIRKFEEGLVI